MTDEELQAIRDEITVYQTHNGAQGDHLVQHHIPALLAEVERLRSLAERLQEARAELRTEAEMLLSERDKAEAQNAALREIVQAVAESDGVMLRLWDGTPSGYALNPKHEGIITKARALLASEGGQP